MRAFATVLVLSFLFSLGAPLSSSATPPLRIVIGVGPAFSHYVQFAAIAKELASRGHEIMLLSSTEDAKFIKKLGADKIPNTTLTYYKAPYSEQLLRDGVREARWMHPVSGMSHAFRRLIGYGHALINDSDAKAALKAFNPHFFLGDFISQAGMALADTLGIPKGMLLIGAFAAPLDTDLFAMGANPLSYVPQLGAVLPAKMGFVHRLQNVIAWVISSMVRELIFIPLNDEIWKEHGIPGSSRLSLRNATLLLVHADFALTRARPLSPHVKVTGALTAAEAKPLPADLEAFAQSAGDDGMVYVSMGTTSIPEERELRDLAKGLSAVPYKVLWKLSNDDSLFLEGKPPLQVGSNVKIVKWCQQNDVLGHPQTKVFVTQGGTNSFMESAYHAVPIVGIPLFAEQPSNVQQAVEGGYGVHVSVFDKKFATALSSAIKEVMSKPRYAEAVQVVSNIMRARRSTPAQTAADAVEEAAWAGHSDHLKAVKYDMKRHEEFNLDVNLFFIAVIGLLLAAGYKLISFVTLLIYRRVFVPATKAGKSD